MKITNTLSAAMLNEIKAALDGGRMYYFAGTVPAEAGDALNMATTHTQLVELTESGDGSTGLTFDTSAGGTLVKAAAEEWSGLIDFDGFIAGPGTATPTFFRMGAAGDNCRGASSAVRLQGTIGGPSSSAEIKLTDGTTLTDNGSNTRSLAIFSVTLSALA